MSGEEIEVDARSDASTNEVKSPLHDTESVSKSSKGIIKDDQTPELLATQIRKFREKVQAELDRGVQPRDIKVDNPLDPNKLGFVKRVLKYANKQANEGDKLHEVWKLVFDQCLEGKYKTSSLQRIWEKIVQRSFVEASSMNRKLWAFRMIHLGLDRITEVHTDLLTEPILAFLGNTARDTSNPLWKQVHELLTRMKAMPEGQPKDLLLRTLLIQCPNFDKRFKYDLIIPMVKDEEISKFLSLCTLIYSKFEKDEARLTFAEFIVNFLKARLYAFQDESIRKLINFLTSQTMHPQRQYFRLRLVTALDTIITPRNIEPNVYLSFAVSQLGMHSRSPIPQEKAALAILQEIETVRKDKREIRRSDFVYECLFSIALLQFYLDEPEAVDLLQIMIEKYEASVAASDGFLSILYAVLVKEPKLFRKVTSIIFQRLCPVLELADLEELFDVCHDDSVNYV